MRKNLKSYFPGYLTSGAIFVYMTKAPWLEMTSGLDMDIAYLGSYSGIKPATSLLDELSDGGVARKERIAEILWSLYGHNWTRLWEAFVAEYSPIENYSVEESLSRDLNNDRTIDRNINKSGSVDTTDTESITTKDDGTSSTTTSGTVGEKTSGTGKVTTTGSENTTTSGEETVTGSNTVDVTTTEKTDTTEGETTTVTYGKSSTTTGHTDTYTYGFNSIQQVPTTVVDDNTTVADSGSDTTKRDLTGSVDVSGTSKTVGSNTSSTKTSGTSATVTGSTTDSTNSGTKDTTTTGKSDTTTSDNGTVNTSDVIATTTTDKTTDGTTDSQVESETTKKTRKGNIGQNTYQELIRQEFELRKWAFYAHVFQDCDKILTLSVFDSCEGYTGSVN